MNELVSVIIAVYNGETYLQEAIDSVRAQTYRPIELLIIDDGSQDGTKRIADVPSVRYFFQPNQGQPAALNYGLTLAHGSFISFLDADDLYLPDKTALQMECLRSLPHTDMVFGHMEQFHCPSLSSEISKKWECPSAITPGYMAAAGLFRRECFERVGPFHTPQRIGAFIDWYMRAIEKKTQHHLIPQLALRRRIHGNNIGIRFQNLRLEYLEIVKAALERRRPHV